MVEKIAARTVTKTSPPRKDPASRATKRVTRGMPVPASGKMRQEEHPGRDDAGVEEAEEEGRGGGSPAGGGFASGRLHPLPGDGRDRPGQDEGQGDEDIAVRAGKEVEIGSLSGAGRREPNGRPAGPRSQ